MILDVLCDLILHINQATTILYYHELEFTLLYTFSASHSLHNGFWLKRIKHIFLMKYVLLSCLIAMHCFTIPLPLYYHKFPFFAIFVFFMYHFKGRVPKHVQALFIFFLTLFPSFFLSSPSSMLVCNKRIKLIT